MKNKLITLATSASILMAAVLASTAASASEHPYHDNDEDGNLSAATLISITYMLSVGTDDGEMNKQLILDANVDSAEVLYNHTDPTDTFLSAKAQVETLSGHKFGDNNDAAARAILALGEQLRAQN